MTLHPLESPAASSCPGDELTIAQLAHELNSLLDGSLRCLRLAERQMIGTADAGEDVGSQLGAARDAMDRMSDLLERAMSTPRPQVDALGSRHPLGERVGQIVALLQPLADEHRITVEWSVDAEIRSLPAGPMEPIIFNGLSNAIEAVARSTDGPRQVTCAVTAVGSGHCKVAIADTGPGLTRTGQTTAGGHGLGLPMCQQIVAGLGGILQLAEAAPGGGTVLMALLPIAQRRSSGAPS